MREVIGGAVSQNEIPLPAFGKIYHRNLHQLERGILPFLAKIDIYCTKISHINEKQSATTNKIMWKICTGFPE